MSDKILTIKKSTLEDIADQVRAKTGSTELIKVADLDDAVKELSGGGGGVVEVDVLPEPTVVVPGSKAPVPNSGYVDKVYLNTSLSDEEVIAELEKLVWSDDRNSIALLDADYVDESIMYLRRVSIDAYKDDDGDGGFTYNLACQIMSTNSDENLGTIYAWESGYGWDSEFSGEINTRGLTLHDIQEVQINPDGTKAQYPVGTQNNQIVNLFYTSEMVPNPEFDEESVYKVSNAPVPNSGPVVPIYFNRSLSTEEVIAEMDKLTYPSNKWGPMPYPVAIIGGRAITIERYVDGDYTSYTIRESMGSAGSSTIFDSANGGWSEYYLEFAEFNNFAQDYEFTSEDNGYPIGDQNHLISNLFSIDPYPTPLWTHEDGKWQCYKKTRKITVINECSDPNMFSFYPDCEHLGNTDGGSLNNHYPKITLQPGQSVELNVVNSLAIDNSNGYEFYDVENARILELQLSKNTYGKFVIVSLSDDNAVVHIRYQS